MEGYCNSITYEILYLFSVSEVWFVNEVCINCLGAKPTIKDYNFIIKFLVAKETGATQWFAKTCSRQCYNLFMANKKRYNLQAVFRCFYINTLKHMQFSSTFP